MSSLIKLPIVGQLNAIPISYNITLQNNNFTRFSTYGAVISNNENEQTSYTPVLSGQTYQFYTTSSRASYNTLTLTQTYSTRFIYPYYLDYVQFLNVARLEYTQRRFTSNYSPGIPPSGIQNIIISSNTFSHFNFLKNSVTEQDSTRTVPYVASVPTLQMRNVGLILDIYNNQQNASVIIANNIFEQIHFYFKDSLTSNPPNHCEGIMNADKYSQYPVLEKSSQSYAQTFDLINFRNALNSSILIVGNQFHNLSIAGPLIFFTENVTVDTQLALVNNTFCYIMGYQATTILNAYRLYGSGFLWGTTLDQQRQFYQQLGGGILIQQNNFYEIAGCPAVAATIALIAAPMFLGDYSKRPDTPDLTNANYYVSNRYGGFALYSFLTPMLPQAWRNITYQGITYNINLNIVNITGNLYTNLSMGTTPPYNQNGGNPYNILGSLYTFVCSERQRFSEEVYTNIGGFTLEHLQQVSMIVKNESTKLVYKGLLDLQNVTSTSYTKSSFYNNFLVNYLSGGVIFTFFSKELIMVGSNTFTNIWLIDRISALSTYLEYYTAIIVQMTWLGRDSTDGTVQFGGNENCTDITTNDGKYLLITNLTGFINPYTISRFPSWNPLNWNPQLAVLVQSQILQYGLGSSLFLILESSYNILVMNNIKLQYIYLRALTSDPQRVSAPLLPLLLYQGNQYPQSQAILSSIEVSDFTFESNFQQAQMVLLQLNLGNGIIHNLTVNNIGSFNMLTKEEWGPFYQDVPANTFQQSLITLSSYTYPGYYPVVQLYILNCTFSNFQNQLGVPVFNVNSFIQYTPLIISNSIFSNFKSRNIIANSIAIQFQTTYQTPFYFQNCTFQNVIAQYGVFFISQGQTVHQITIDSSQFKNAQGVNALFTLQPNQLQVFLLRNSIIDVDKDSVSAITVQEEILAGETSNFINSNIIQYTGNISVTITGCTISNNNRAPIGGFLDLQNSAINISNSSFQCKSFFVLQISIDLSAIQGGVISAQNSQVYIFNSTFANNQAERAGVIQLIQNSTMLVSESIFSNNFAIENAVFEISSLSQFNFTDCQFTFNIAEVSNSVGQVLEVKAPCFFINNVFLENQAYFTATSIGGNGLEVLQSRYQISLIDCTIRGNIARSSSGFLSLMGMSEFLIESCIFDNSNSVQDPNTLVKGAFIQALAGTNLIVNNSVYLGGYAQYGGSAYIQGDVSVVIINSVFEENIATRQGGALYAESFLTINITDNTEFFKNNAINMTGDALFVSTSDYYLDIRDSWFHSTQASNFIIINQVNQASIVKTIIEIEEIQFNNLGKIAGVQTSDIKLFLVDQSIFRNLIGSSVNGGGALQLAESQSNKSPTNSLIIQRSNFENCSNINGGAIGINDVGGVQIINGTMILGNIASSAGGGIFFSCNNHGSNSNMCSLNVEDTIIQNNFAGIEGGAIKWNVYEPIMNNNSFKGNNASIYGNNIASIAKKLVRVESFQITLSTLPLQQRLLVSSLNIPVSTTANNTDLSNLQSGTTMDLYFVLVDKYSAIVRTDNTSKLYLSPVQNKVSNFTSLIESATSLYSENGVFSILDFQFVGEPNSSQKINVTTDGIDYTIPDNQVVQNSSDSPFFELSLELRACYVGESLSVLGQCSRCEDDTYLLFASTQPSICLPCPINNQAECLGGNLIYPMPGYWRSSLTSDNMIKCRNGIACLGRKAPNDNPFGACYTGYQGVICADCAVGYSRTGSNYQCSQCPHRQTNIVKITGLLLLVILGLIFLVKSTLNSAHSEQNLLSVMIRILMNHLQLLALTASFDLEWPQELIDFFSFTQPAADATTQFLSVDCAMDIRSQSNFSIINATAVINGVLSYTSSIDGLFTADGGVYRVYFLKLIILALLPFLVLIGSIATWNVLFAQKNIWMLCKRTIVKVGPIETGTESISQAKQKGKGGKIIATIVVILFLIQPTITKLMLSAFNCENIDGTQRLYDDLQVVCYSYIHQRIAYIVALPALIIWGLGIPCEGLFLVCKNRKRLDKYSVKSKYSFLYNGYKRKAFYWEFVIMYRKIIMIFIKVFMLQQGKLVSAMTTLAFLVIMVAVTAALRPFLNRPLNTLEQLSLFSSAITVYCGIFFVSNVSGSDFSMGANSISFLLSVVVAFNTLFASVWVILFLQQLRENIRKAVPKFYLIFFSCMNKKRVEQEEIESKQMYENQQIMNEFESVIDYFKMKQSQYNGSQKPGDEELGLQKFVQNICMAIEYNQARDNLREYILMSAEEARELRKLKLDKNGYDATAAYVEQVTLGNEEEIKKDFNDVGSVKERVFDDTRDCLRLEEGPPFRSKTMSRGGSDEQGLSVEGRYKHRKNQRNLKEHIRGDKGIDIRKQEGFNKEDS